MVGHKVEAEVCLLQIKSSISPERQALHIGQSQVHALLLIAERLEAALPLLTSINLGVPNASNAGGDSKEVVICGEAGPSPRADGGTTTCMRKPVHTGGHSDGAHYIWQ